MTEELLHHATLHERCCAVELLLLDVDGVLTDGGIVYGDNEIELKTFHVRDGSGLKIWHHAGKKAAIISGRKSPVVDVRAAELDVGLVIQGAADKLAAYQQVLAETGLVDGQVCFLADDLPDLPVLRRCGLAVAVADACPEVRQAAHYITHAAGGRGAVRETIDLILQGQEKWRSVVDRYRDHGLHQSGQEA